MGKIKMPQLVRTRFEAAGLKINENWIDDGD